MDSFILNRNLAQLALLQRIELAEPKLKRVRKIFGRYLFSKIFSKYFLFVKKISKNYALIMGEEFNTIKKFIKNKKNFLSIGAGIGGLELLIIRNIIDSNVSFIEKDYISDKIKYGWDNLNKEGYNDLKQLAEFLKHNGVSKERYQIFNFDKKNFPISSFDIILSIYSLDYHYDFEIYFDYLKKVMRKDTVLIFDTIRPKYFESIFSHIEIIREDIDTVHKSKRIVCKLFK